MMIYNKLPLTYSQQIALMENRGLAVPDKQKAQRYLEEISYYRLSAYTLPFQQIKDVYNSTTTFDSILDLYLFDKELRLIVFDVIERIEIAIRAQMIYQLAHKYGSHWQDNPLIFSPPYKTRKGLMVNIFDETQKIISDSCNAHFPEVFIKHYKSKYTKPNNPPSWMCVELLSIGQLSRLYAALKNTSDKRDIATFFNLHHSIFHSWIHTLTYGRNICAHHSRLWNREFAIQSEIPQKNLPLPWISQQFHNNRRCFYFLSTLKYLLGKANPTNHFKNKLVELIRKYPSVPIQYMGIPSDGKGNLLNWKNEPLWL